MGDSDVEEALEMADIANQANFDNNIQNLEMLEVSNAMPTTRKYTVRKRIDPFTFYDNDEFKKRYRLTKDMVELLYNMIDGENTLEPLVSRPGFTIPGITKLLIALRYYAAGVSALTLADMFGASKSLASNTVADVSTIIAAKIKNIQMPANRNEILKKNEKVKFHRFCGFPLAIGAVDGTHIRIRSLGGEDAEYYRNRKSYFSMNCQLTVSADVYMFFVT